MLPDFLLISSYLNLKMSVYVMLGPDTFSTDASKNYAFLKIMKNQTRSVYIILLCVWIIEKHPKAC